MLVELRWIINPKRRCLFWLTWEYPERITCDPPLMIWLGLVRSQKLLTGDTFYVMRNCEEVSVSLYGIDCPDHD